jgi:hypothetical protein
VFFTNMQNLNFLYIYKTNTLGHLLRLLSVLTIMSFINIKYHSFKHTISRRKIDMSEIINEINEDINMKLISDGYLPNEYDNDDCIRKSLNSQVGLNSQCYKDVRSKLIHDKLLYLSECNLCAGKVQGNLAEFDRIYKYANQLEQKYNASFKEGIDSLKEFFDNNWEEYKNSKKL